MATSPRLEVIDLSFRHPAQPQPTIAGVNLALYPGEIVSIAGATGSGKSTLLNCLAGISPNHTGGKLQGKILYEGVDIQSRSVRQRSQHFCTLLQNVETQIFTDCVWEELLFGLENWNIPPARIPHLANAALQEFGLEAQRNWAIAQLSAGQKQRLLLACQLLIDQPVLLLDEPLAYLDAKGVAILLQLLRAKAEEGRSIVLVEHRMDMVEEICDRFYTFEDGTLFEVRSGQRKSDRREDMPAIGFSNPTEFDRFGMSSSSSTAATILLRTYQLGWGAYPPFPDMEVAAGETVLLKGDNGCGKTTLLKLLSGLLKPSTGTLEILGRNANRRSVVQIARDVGFVLQNPNHQLFADSVRSEVLQSGVCREFGMALLERLNLSDRGDRHPQSLSQGQKRRLALGAVLARQPKICLLDEIMVGQDPNSLALMLNVLRDFTDRGGALILTSHVPLPSDIPKLKLLELCQSQ